VEELEKPRLRPGRLVSRQFQPVRAFHGAEVLQGACKRDAGVLRFAQNDSACLRTSEKQEKPRLRYMRPGRPVSGTCGWLAFYDFAGLDAAGADAHALAAAIDLGLDGLQVDVPATAGGVVGVRDVVAELRAFAAEITFLCHDELLQS
jgi:hypothetical protein